MPPSHSSATAGNATLNPDGTVSYDPDGAFNDLAPGEDATDTFTYRASDGSAQSPSATVTVTVEGVNDAPAVAAGAGAPATFTENQAGQVTVDPGLSVTDIDSSQLTGATVAIGSGFVVGDDDLHFSNQNGISHTYNTGTGVLTLTGTASVADYQTALRSVAFSTDSDDPGTGRTITFKARSGRRRARPPLAASLSSRPTTPRLRTPTRSRARRALSGTRRWSSTTRPMGRQPRRPEEDGGARPPGGRRRCGRPPGAVGRSEPQHHHGQGGKVAIEADGDLTYNPPAGCNHATDTFEYTVTDGHSPTPGTDQATLTIHLADCVWYVDGDAATNGDGRSQSPMNTLAGLRSGTDPDTPDDTIFLYTRDARPTTPAAWCSRAASS